MTTAVCDCWCMDKQLVEPVGESVTDPLAVRHLITYAAYLTYIESGETCGVRVLCGEQLVRWPGKLLDLEVTRTLKGLFSRSTGTCAACCEMYGTPPKGVSYRRMWPTVVDAQLKETVCAPGVFNLL